MNVFVNGTFIMPQKKSFGKKNFEFHAWVQKCHFGRMEKLPIGTGQRFEL